MADNLPIDVALPVARALAAGRGVVALESTIISHGMPWPRNLETAQAVEDAVHANGATAATIAVLDGRIRIGLTAGELEDLARDPAVMKLSRADLAHALALRATGATTVAATMICAHAAGIRIFATGGIGGVHRGVEDSMDISADLEELARTPVAVVCAGAKAILDLPRTMEVLETKGVPVVGYGVDCLPAFWSRDSKIPVPIQLNEVADVGRFLALHFTLSLGGTVIANPVPAADEIPAAEMAGYIDAAVGAATTAGVLGKALTPFLLDHIQTASAGRSLDTNIALVKNNAALAAQIAGFMAAQ